MKTVVESLSAPPLFYRLSDIEKGFINVFAFGNDINMVSPWHKGEWQWGKPLHQPLYLEPLEFLHQFVAVL